VLNDVIVSGLPGLVGLPVHPQLVPLFDVLQSCYCRFSAECIRNKIKIGQYLAKIWTKVSWHLFMAHSVKSFLQGHTTIGRRWSPFPAPSAGHQLTLRCWLW